MITLYYSKLAIFVPIQSSGGEAKTTNCSFPFCHFSVIFWPDTFKVEYISFFWVLFFFPQGHRVLMFCEHLSDFGCFCSHFPIFFTTINEKFATEIHINIFFSGALIESDLNSQELFSNSDRCRSRIRNYWAGGGEKFEPVFQSIFSQSFELNKNSTAKNR